MGPRISLPFDRGIFERRRRNSTVVHLGSRVDEGTWNSRIAEKRSGVGEGVGFERVLDDFRIDAGQGMLREGKVVSCV